MIVPSRFSEADVLASVCADSFYQFVREFWSVVIPEEPVWNWHIEYLCNEMQKVAELVFCQQPKEYDLIINVPPGSTKSTICSIMFPAWAWTRMKTARTICGSYAYPLAMDLSRKSRDIVTSRKVNPTDPPRYAECYPEIALREDQNAKGYFANVHGGIRYSVGVGGSVTGMHGHFIIVDDPLNPLEALSEPELHSANLWMSETLSSRKVDKRITPTILIMQRLHEDDPTGNRLLRTKAGPIRHICLPVDDTWEVKPEECQAYYRQQKGMLDPIRLSPQVIKEAEGELGEVGYAGQYGQSPVPRGGATFKVEKLNVIKSPPVLKSVVRYWDKAASKAKGCFTVGAKLGVEMRQIGDKVIPHYVILDIQRGQWDTWTREQRILKTAQQDGTKVRVGIEEEGGSGGKDSALMTVSMLSGFRVIVDKPTGDKETRADPFSSAVNGGNVSVVDGPWLRDLIAELRQFPNSKYKDQVDGLSGAFKLLTKRRTMVGAL